MAATSVHSLPIAGHRSVTSVASAARASVVPVRVGVVGGRSAAMARFTGLRIVRRASKVSEVAAVERVVRRVSVVCEAQEIAVNVPDVTTATWQSLVMECENPVLVEFWAPWCGPCRLLLPVISKLAKTYEDKLKCFKLNTDQCPEIANKYGIRSIPTIMIFKNGEKKDTVIGAVPESTLVTCIEKIVTR